MAAGRFVVPPYFPARDRDFNLLSGALLYVYENNTTTKSAIYTDEALTVLSSNPVVANSSGQFPAIYAEAGTEASPVLYSVSVTTSTGASPGNPFNFNNYRPSVDWETAAVALAEAAADAAEDFRDEAEVFKDESEVAAIASVAALAEILEIAADAPDAPSIVNKANLNGDNVSGANATAFLEAIGDLSGLADQGPVAGTDLLATYRTPGPLKGITVEQLLSSVVPKDTDGSDFTAPGAVLSAFRRVVGTNTVYPVDGTDAGPALQTGITALPSLSQQVLTLPTGDSLIATGVTIPNISTTTNFGVGVTSLAAPLTTNGNRNQSFNGLGHGSVVQAVASINLFEWSGSQNGSPAERLTEFKRMALRGNSIGLTGIRQPDTNLNSFFDGLSDISYCSVTGFEEVNVKIGRSNYVTNIVGLHSSNGGTGLEIGRDADSNITTSVFSFPRDGALVHLRGIQNRLLASVFDRGGAGGKTSGLGPDVLIGTGGTGAGGGNNVAFNKHGSEGEIIGRPKIRVQDTVATTTPLGSDNFLYDHFYCYLGGKQTVFDLLNPTVNTLIDGHYFSDAGTIVSDKPVASGETQGGGVFGPNNRVGNAASNPQYPTQLFRYGGFGFNSVTAPFNVAHINAPDALAGPAQNRLLHPLDFSSWTFNASFITVTGGQADPFGGTDAYLLEKASPNTSTGLSCVISTTNLVDDMGRPSGPASVTASIDMTDATATGTASIAQRAGLCYFVGSISGTTLTVTEIGSELIQLGKLITNLNVVGGTSIVSQLTGPTGGAGTYTVSASQTVASSPMRIPITYAVMTVATQLTGMFRAGDELTGTGVVASQTILGQLSSDGVGQGGSYRLSIDQSAAASTTMTGTRSEPIMTVTAVGSGELREGGTVAGTGVTADTTILEQRTGAFGGTGTYLVSTAQTVASTTITSTIRNGRGVLAVWLRAATSQVCDVILRDGTFGGFLRQQLSLSTAWKRYRFPVSGLQAGLSPTVILYPGGVNTSEAAAIYAAHASFSDFGSEWLPTQTISQPVGEPRPLLFTAALTPASVAANTSVEQTFAVTGLLATDLVEVSAPATVVGLVKGNARVTAANTLGIEWGNLTAGALSPAAGTYNITVTRKRC